MSKMQKPSGGCYSCGGPVRTWKPEHEWTCAKCVRNIKRKPRESNVESRWFTAKNGEILPVVDKTFTRELLNSFLINMAGVPLQEGDWERSVEAAAELAIDGVGLDGYAKSFGVSADELVFILGAIIHDRSRNISTWTRAFGEVLCLVGAADNARRAVA
ncbi:hypothetical protein BO226_04730 [Rhodococcus sp. 2G]|uniref:hypothetical protein n=1 Tax=Rhodococcus sp. 2G TaxID=1570939 RepID=UPI0009040EAB|nr:hypothetical protein [Rhodococcus sp. 2G]APE08612.1 hypothetical protein BO226_04730 [Rhodococcus sp. 2G]